jgi:hypothetical protein
MKSRSTIAGVTHYRAQFQILINKGPTFPFTVLKFRVSCDRTVSNSLSTEVLRRTQNLAPPAQRGD